MKITFPHIGPVYLAAAMAMKQMEIPHVVPPANTLETLEKGKAVSPEEMCLPFKFMAGNLIQAYEQGARRVIMPATMGPCRLGEYGELLKQVLSRAGYSMDWVLMDTPKAIGILEWVKRLNKAGSQRATGPCRTAAVLFHTIQLMRRMDLLESRIKHWAGYAKEPSECVRLIRRFRQELYQAQNLKESTFALEKYRKELDDIPVCHSRNPVRILITGEIYTSIESAANQNLEELLMLMGCQVRRPVTISWWMKHMVAESLPKRRKQANLYLPYDIGGYAKETVEEIRTAADDGIIKIMPAGCMPEIVAKAASNVIEEKQGTKVLHLIFDEMQGNAGYETRVEAFVDMLERRKRVFSGS